MLQKSEHWLKNHNHQMKDQDCQAFYWFGIATQIAPLSLLAPTEATRLNEMKQWSFLFAISTSE